MSEHEPTEDDFDFEMDTDDDAPAETCDECGEDGGACVCIDDDDDAEDWDDDTEVEDDE